MKKIYIALLIITAAFSLNAQGTGHYNYKILGNDLFLSISEQAGAHTIDSLLATCGLDPAQLQAYYNSGLPTDQGWFVVNIGRDKTVLRKPVSEFNSTPENQKDLLFMLAPEAPPEPGYPYGFNTFSKPAVKELPDGRTMFFLAVEGTPRSIYLSGSFNEWSTLATPLQKVDSGYAVTVKLADGAHQYKYVVNGHWVLDPRNKTKKADWMGNENSLYFKTNYQFTLKSFPKAKKVYLAGSFNNWQEKEIALQRTDGIWQRSVFLPDGTHSYKFLVDGKWILDPDNHLSRSDGMGSTNSYLAIGDTFYFHLPGAEKANDVRVAGSFNGWNESDLRLAKTDSGWVLPYVLQAGNYEYKFLVDGQWQLDPTNPLATGENEFTNSVLAIDPNFTFELKGYPKAEKVSVVGDFNDWAETGVSMYRKNGQWRAKLHLPKGKQRYKFIVDGEWILDPANNTWEGNEYGSGNSVVWVQ